MTKPPQQVSPIDAFIHRWESSGAAERANYALFLTQLCDLLGVPQPEPTTPDAAQNAYVFERDVTFDQGDGTTTTGRIDLYKRGCFVLEAKQGSDQERAEEQAAKALAPPTAKKSTKKKGTAVRGTKGWDDAMVKARGQAEAYAKALPAGEGWPPFLIVVDVGHSIELYSEFTRSGKAYVMFPDPLSFRLKLADLRDEKIRARLAAVWTDPLALDPSRRSAKVTRELAQRLAELAKLLEKAGHEPSVVAKFLMRCLFTMFAEDVELIPRGSFKDLLESMREEPENFQPMMEALWQTMNAGGFSPILRKKLLKFNGGLFAESQALPLDKPMLALLIEAARSDWADVEPAIFGTLLERALDVHERHKLGAHYTPRTYVERLVMPTVIEPLRDEWKTVYAAAISHAKAGEMAEAQAEVRQFHEQLCATRVLDPACGSGNFLYVTLEHMKRLEGEILNALRELGDKQQILESHEVDPHQFLGIEVNPRAAAIADLVLWIGYLQWHFRTRGKTQPAEPIIRNYKNIECRDAVLAWDRTEPVLDEAGQPVTRWDGRTEKRHPATGELIPDDSARVPVLHYLKPRKAEWPEADYIVGNPPYIGVRRMKLSIGDEYVDCLRSTYPEVPETSDLVMYWWHKAAQLIGQKKLSQFGLITTNSVVQAYSNRVIAESLGDPNGTAITFAIPDHPWVDSEDGAAVRVAMTVSASKLKARKRALLGVVVAEEDEDARVEMKDVGTIGPRLREEIGLDDMVPLKANEDCCFQGVVPAGDGFKLDEDELRALGVSDSRLPSHIRRYIIGRDLVRSHQKKWIIDFFGSNEDEARSKSPDCYQRLVDRVLPERKENKRDSYRIKWWIFAEPRPAMRNALSGLKRFVVTPYTAKYRLFIFVDGVTLPDAMAYAVASDDGWFHGVLSSRVHSVFALTTGGRMGIGNDPRYTSQRCFLPFPFPTGTDKQKSRIRELAEQLDAHRKRQQELHPGLTMTGMYNVLEKLRAGEELSDKEKLIHEQGLVSVLRQIHDDLDQAVFAAYGWPSTLSDEEILERLVALNAERAAEEARGLIRWLRPEFQAPQGAQQKQGQLTLPKDEETKPAKKPKTAKATKTPWPKERSQRTKAIQDALAATPAPITPADLAKQFLRGNAGQIEDILDALCALGLARKSRGRFTMAK